MTWHCIYIHDVSLQMSKIQVHLQRVGCRNCSHNLKMSNKTSIKIHKYTQCNCIYKYELLTVELFLAIALAKPEEFRTRDDNRILVEAILFFGLDEELGTNLFRNEAQSTQI